MKVLVLGARGFVGRHIVVALEAAGHEVLVPTVEFAEALYPEAWRAHLQGADAVVNAVGIFRERRIRRFSTVHDEAPRALFAACEQAGVQHVVQISALGADEAARSAFHRSKKRADDFLATRDLQWAIVLPSIVFGRGGASTRLFALLASLPWIPLPGNGAQRIQPVHIDDLAAAVAHLVASPGRRRVNAVGAEALTVRDWLTLLRRQMGLRRAPCLAIPRQLLPIARETMEMLDRGNTAEPAGMAHALGRSPRGPEDFLSLREGGSLALEAKLAWLLPLLRASIATVWVLSGVISLGLYPVEESVRLLARVGIGSPAVVYGAALLDIALGVAVYALKRRRWLWRLQLGVICAYSAVLAIWLPEVWLHPFGPAIKNLPMLAVIATLHELEERGPWTTW